MPVVTKAQAKDPSRKPSKAEAHPLYKVTRSKVHGFGAFATRDIRKGETIDEYLGDRITHAQADKRYEDHDENDNHTFLFIVDKKTVIDAGIGGNDARFINHKCDPNCESEIKKGRVFIIATKNIAKGEELGYDYQIGREKDDPENVDEIYACRCGSPKCRGTMLWPAKRPSPKKRKKKVARKAKKSASSRSGKKTQARKKK
jgi:SET domain-containing protein